jgi:TonB family protein
MLRIRMAVVFLVCCTALGFAQNPADTQSQPPANPPQTVQVSAADMAGLADNKVLPQYPKEALAKGIEGDVIFKINVDENGKIVGSELVQGHPMLVAATRDALRNYTFHPYLLNGTPVRVASQMGFHFTLTRDGDSTKGQVECMSSIP